MFESPMSFLHEGIDRLQAEEVATLPDGRVDDDVVEISRAIDRLRAERLRRLRQWETRGVWAHDGSRSARAALARRTGSTVGSAGGDLKLAGRLEDAPATTAAFSSGEIGVDKARLLTAPLDDGATDTLRQAFADCEATLVDAAKGLSACNVRYLVAHWAAAADPDGYQDRCNDQYRHRRVHLSQSFEGCWHLEGFLDPETGAVIKQVLDALSDRKYRHDRRDDVHPDERRTKEQRDADSLREIADTARADLDPDTDTDDTGIEALDADVEPTEPTEPTGPQAPSARRGIRPTIAVVVDLQRICGDRTGVAMLSDSNMPLTQAALERHLCDCNVVRVLCSADSAPLDVGRSTRQPPVSVLRALVIRDGGCAFPDCDMPPRWCDAHHILPWEDHGKTKLENLVLVCRHHHRLVHDHSWSVRLDERGRPRFRTPEGDELAPDPTPLDVARRGADIAQRDRRQRLDHDIGEAHRRRREPGDPDG